MSVAPQEQSYPKRAFSAVYPTVAKWRVESKRKQRQMQRAAVEPQDDEPIEQDNSTSGFGDLIDVPVNDQWLVQRAVAWGEGLCVTSGELLRRFSLEWPRQFDREQGSVRLRVTVPACPLRRVVLTGV